MSVLAPAIARVEGHARIAAAGRHARLALEAMRLAPEPEQRDAHQIELFRLAALARRWEAQGIALPPGLAQLT